PADSNFCGDRSPGDGANDGSGDGSEFGGIPEHGGARVHTNDAVGGATEIDVDEVRLQSVHQQSGGLAHAGGIRAEDLNAHGTLGFGEVDGFPQFRIFPHQRVGLYELSDHDIRALFFAELAEYNIRHPRHRGEVEGETAVLKPGKHGGIWKI